MRKLIPFIVAGISALSFGQAMAAGPLVGPGVVGDKSGVGAGAGPHRERGTSAAPRDNVEVIEAPVDNPKDSATAGSSAAPGTAGKDMDAIERDEDRAARNKNKFKQRPGYREDVPQPRASAPVPRQAAQN